MLSFNLEFPFVFYYPNALCHSFRRLSIHNHPSSHWQLLLSQTPYHTYTHHPYVHPLFFHTNSHCHHIGPQNTHVYSLHLCSLVKVKITIPTTFSFPIHPQTYAYHSHHPYISPHLLCHPVALHHPKYHPTHSPSASPSAGRAASLAAAHDSAEWSKLN